MKINSTEEELLGSIKEGVRYSGIALLDEHAGRLAAFGAAVLEQNRRMNLTRIDSVREFAAKHIVDSLFGLTVLPDVVKCIDVGSGAGFPGIVLAVTRPESSFVLLDSVKKKVDFTAEAAERTGIRNVHSIHGRAEELARDCAYRDQFDFVVARAVAPLRVLVEYCVPFVMVGGRFAAYKGPGGADEIKEAQNALQILGVEQDRDEEFELPWGMGVRRILVFRKCRVTPSGYPRRPGSAKRKPL